MSQWYYRSGRKVVGPMSSSELLEKVRTGEVTGTTMVRKENSQWVTAKSVTGLFHKAGVWAGEHRCPHCGAHISEPPTTCEICQRHVDVPRVSQDAYRYSQHLDKLQDKGQKAE